MEGDSNKQLLLAHSPRAFAWPIRQQQQQPDGKSLSVCVLLVVHSRIGRPGLRAGRRTQRRKRERLLPNGKRNNVQKRFVDSSSNCITSTRGQEKEVIFRR